MTRASPPAVPARLGFPPESGWRRYVRELAHLRPDPGGVLSPLDPAEAAERCTRLGLAPLDTSEVLATLPSPGTDPDWWWCTERAVWAITTEMGDLDAPDRTWPEAAGDPDARRRCHFFHVALAVAPHTVAWLTGRGLEERLAWGCLADVARHAAIHRRVHGTTGMDAAWWVARALRGELVELGRLQYHRYRLGQGEESPPWYGARAAAARGEGFGPGGECVGVHIPEGSPLDPAAVDASLALAGEVLARHFPPALPQRRRLATCRSWLLDPQLGEYLPPTSRIVAFQRRFELVPRAEPGDDDVLEFVFRAPPGAALDGLPQRTTLERAVVAHLRAGRHWERRTGWLPLPGS